MFSWNHRLECAYWVGDLVFSFVSVKVQIMSSLCIFISVFSRITHGNELGLGRKEIRPVDVMDFIFVVSSWTEFKVMSFWYIFLSNFLEKLDRVMEWSCEETRRVMDSDCEETKQMRIF